MWLCSFRFFTFARSFLWTFLYFLLLPFFSTLKSLASSFVISFYFFLRPSFPSSLFLSYLFFSLSSSSSSLLLSSSPFFPPQISHRFSFFCALSPLSLSSLSFHHNLLFFFFSLPSQVTYSAPHGGWSRSWIVRRRYSEFHDLYEQVGLEGGKSREKGEERGKERGEKKKKKKRKKRGWEENKQKKMFMMMMVMNKKSKSKSKKNKKKKGREEGK